MDFDDIGTGPSLLFLPGSYSTSAAWNGVQKFLQGQCRLISTSLPGYGRSREVRNNTVSDMVQMTDFAKRIVDHIGEPVHLVGHSYGGLVAFASTLGKMVKPLSMITFEANPVFSRPEGREFPWLQDILDTNQRFEEAFAKGNQDAAAIIIDFWGHSGFFQAMPEQVREYCRKTTSTNILDWRSAAGFTPLMSDYAAIDIPCTVVRGEQANPAITGLTEALSAVLPNSTECVVKGAGHFLISTHAKDCATIIDTHMAQFNSRG